MFKEAIGQDPSFTEAYRYLIGVYRHCGEYELASDTLYQVYELEPASASAEQHFNLGNLLLKQGKTLEANTCYRRAIAINPQFTAAYQKLNQLISSLKAQGETSSNNNRKNQSRLIKPAKENEARSIEYKALVDQADQAFAAENWQLAEDCCFQAIRIDPNQWQALHQLGEVLSKQENWSKAVNAYTKSIKLNAEFSWSFNNLGYALIQLERWSEAIKAYRYAIKLNPTFPWAYYNMAEALGKLEQWHEAVPLLQKALQLAPNLISQIQPKLADALYRQSYDNHDQALETCLEAIKESPDNIALYHQALAIDQKNVELYLKLGNLLVQSGELEQAFVIYQTILEIQPQHQEALAKWQETKLKLQPIDLDASFSSESSNQPNPIVTPEKQEEILAQLRQQTMELEACHKLWGSSTAKQTKLSYGCWLTPSILYLEIEDDGFDLSRAQEILLCSANSYVVVKANLFQLTPTQVAAVVCYQQDGDRERIDEYQLAISLQKELILVSDKISHRAYSLEFIQYMNARANSIKLLVREHLNQALIALVSESTRLEIAELIHKIQHFMVATPVNYVEQSLPFNIYIDSLIPLECSGLFISGWLHDPQNMLEKIYAVSDLGFTLEFSTQDIYSLERPDVNEFLQTSRYLSSEQQKGFCSYISVPEHIRDGVQDLAKLHSFRFLIQLRGNIELEIIPDVQYGDYRQSRSQVLHLVNPEQADSEMMENCLAPTAWKLQQLFAAQASTKTVEQIGIPVASPLASIVVPLYRRLDFIKIQLAKLAHDPTTSQCEIIYVLDSPEQERELQTLLKHYCALYNFPVKLVIMEQNGGYAAANNAGVEQATSQYVVLLNSDVFPQTKGWIRKMVEFYESSEKIGVLGAKLLYEDDSLQHAGMFFAQTTFPFWLTLHYYKGLPGSYTLAQKNRSVPAVTGACMMISRELYHQVGGMTTDYVVGDFEDSDLCLKCAELGYETWYLADVALYHLERQSVPLNGLYQSSLAWRLNGLLHHQRWGEKIASLMATTNDPGGN